MRSAEAANERLLSEDEVKVNCETRSGVPYSAHDERQDHREILLRKAISDLVRYERNKQYMTQEQLAGRSGISYEHLNHIENYKAMPSLEVLDKIARSLGFARLSEFLVSQESKLL